VHTGLLWALVLARGAVGAAEVHRAGLRHPRRGRQPARRRLCRRAGGTVVLVALLSGALAGLAGAIEVAGRTSYVTLDMSPGYGYSGIVIAMLAGLHPLGVVLRQRVCGRRAGGGRQHEPRGGRAHLHRRCDRGHLADRGAGGHAADAIPGALEAP
jgi:ABC-type uncharacterized transport system permease subunit